MISTRGRACLLAAILVTGCGPSSTRDNAGLPSGDSSLPSPEARERAPAAAGAVPSPSSSDLEPAEESFPRDAEWPSFLGPDGNGHSREKGLVHQFPGGGPKILWKAELGTGYSGVTVARGRATTLFGKDGREYIVCFDAASGDMLWTVDSDNDFAEGRSPGPRSTPAADGDRVYALGASGHLCCLEGATGKIVWDCNVTEKFGFRLHEEGLSPSPLIDGKNLILPMGRSVYAIDKATGNQVWKSLEDPMNHSSPRIATIDGRRQLVVLSQQNLVGLSPDDGHELWRHPQQAVNIAVPVVGPGDQIFIGAGYGYGCQLVQVSGGKPRQVYKNAALATHHATAVLHEGFLYGFDDRPGIFKCIEFATGKECWVAREVGKGNLIVADGQIILLNEEGVLFLAPVSPDGFKPTAKARLFRDGLCYTAPSLAAGRLYLRSDRELVCIALKE